ncbi:MAG: LytTR family transcriptional regulator DNA-binding domain-containing protein [Lentimicrobiaceae bacterium]|nr:LytTR family transcriptional regulator DNA-binding domain-containing protein [Lentimicrobiaceae bacterium]
MNKIIKNQPKICPLYLHSLFFLISLRDGGFYIFFTLLALYRNNQIIASNKERSLIDEQETIAFLQSNGTPVSFNINKLVYFEQRQNKTTIFTTLGTSCITYSSLADHENSFGDKCIRINRNTLVFFDKILGFDQESLTVRDSKNGGTTMLYFFKNNPLAVYTILQKRITELEKKNAEKMQKTQNDNVNNDEKHKCDDVKIGILEEIRKNPGINAIKLFKNFETKTSLPTLRRRLQELTESDLIEFKGAAKTGGYYIVQP